MECCFNYYEYHSICLFKFILSPYDYDTNWHGLKTIGGWEGIHCAIKEAVISRCSDKISAKE